MSEENLNLSTPLPKKVKQVEFYDKGLSIETTLEEKLCVPWSDIVFFFAGKIEKKSEAKPQASSGPKVNIVRTAASLAAGPIGTALYDLSAKKEKPINLSSSTESFLLADLYILQNLQPFRFDSIGTNFKPLLKEETTYASDLNFLNFIRKIAPFLNHLRNTSLFQIVEKGKNALEVFPSRDAFAWRSYSERKKSSPPV
jgi:hypothetical protein